MLIILIILLIVVLFYIIPKYFKTEQKNNILDYDTRQEENIQNNIIKDETKSINKNSINIQNKQNDLINNICSENNDCKYIWYTGGCYIPEYIAERQKKNQEQGLSISEAQPRENVTCLCENNVCITHN